MITRPGERPAATPVSGMHSSATVCYMDTVSHRELRNNSADVLRRVEAGESITITNRGRVTAVIGPAVHSALDQLTERGQVRPARAAVDSLRAIRRRRSTHTSAEIIADSRGEW